MSDRRGGVSKNMGKRDKTKLRWSGNKLAQEQSDAAWTRAQKPRKQKSLYVDYYKYIKSAKWKKKRELAFKVLGRNCCICKTKKNLRVHHKTYKRLGREKITDLQILCDSCHSIEHEKDGVSARDNVSRQFRKILGE